MYSTGKAGRNPHSPNTRQRHVPTIKSGKRVCSAVCNTPTKSPKIPNRGSARRDPTLRTRRRHAWIPGPGLSCSPPKGGKCSSSGREDRGYRSWPGRGKSTDYGLTKIGIRPLRQPCKRDSDGTVGVCVCMVPTASVQHSAVQVEVRCLRCHTSHQTKLNPGGCMQRRTRTSRGLEVLLSHSSGNNGLHGPCLGTSRWSTPRISTADSQAALDRVSRPLGRPSLFCQDQPDARKIPSALGRPFIPCRAALARCPSLFYSIRGPGKPSALFSSG